MDHSQHHAPKAKQNRGMQFKHYRKLIIMAVLSFIAMYVLMYSMVNNFSNVFSNVNQFYMAGLMTMPMIIIEIILMRNMYMNKKFNVFIIGISAALLIAFFFLIREQAGVSDRQFIKSMIPHHGAAILMVEKTTITDPELKKITEEIITSQQKEIEQMKSILERLEK